MHVPNQNHYYDCPFSKMTTKKDDGDVFGWIFGHVSLLKLEKHFEDDNRYAVLQIDIVTSRKYCNTSNEYSTNH